MQEPVGRFHALMTEPLVPRTRLLLLGLMIPLAVSFTQPLWNIHFAAPEFSQSLDLDIYAHTIEGDIGGRTVARLGAACSVRAGRISRVVLWIATAMWVAALLIQYFADLYWLEGGTL